MRRIDKNLVAVFLICFVLLVAAGVIGFYSGNMMPREIKPAQVEPEKITAESTASTPTIDQQFDELQESVGALVNIVKEVPQFFYLMGTKIFSPETVNPNEQNVFSVAKV